MGSKRARLVGGEDRQGEVGGRRTRPNPECILELDHPIAGPVPLIRPVEVRGDKTIGDGDADHVALRHAVQVPGRTAFKARIAPSKELAEKTLGLQDYIREPGATVHTSPNL